MSYKLFIDDERHPVTNDFIIVRNYDEAMSVINEKGLPSFISFDHDLGEGKSGYDVARAICEYCFTNNIQPDFDYYVHSQNPVGAKYIRDYLEWFKQYYNYSIELVWID